MTALAMARASFIGSSEGTHHTPVRSPEERADDDEDHVQQREGDKQRVGEKSLFREPFADARNLAVDVRRQHEEGDFYPRNADTAPERRIADEFLQPQEVPRSFGG